MKDKAARTMKFSYVVAAEHPSAGCRATVNHGFAGASHRTSLFSSRTGNPR